MFHKIYLPWSHVVDHKMLWSFACFMICFVRICSIGLQAIQVSDIGLYFAASDLFSFLKTGLIFAVSQSSGTTPESYHFLNMTVNIGAITFAISFNTWGLIWSGPDNVWTFRDLSLLRINFWWERTVKSCNPWPITASPVWGYIGC